MKKALIAILIGSALGLSACQPAPQPVDLLKVEVLNLETDQQKQAYAMGASVGQFIEAKAKAIKQAGVTADSIAQRDPRAKAIDQEGEAYDTAIIVKGFIAALQGQSQLSTEEIQTLTQEIEALVREKKAEADAKVGEANIAAGQAFLAENAKREGVVVTESGLQYEVITQGDGAKPSAEDTVEVHYEGTLLDGTVFDSSYARNEPIMFPLSRVIRGWTEGVQLMSVGSKYKLYIPAELAYGPRSTGLITPNSTLIFTVELLNIETPAEN